MEAALTASLEDYLEVISNTIAEKQAVRPKDIARKLKVAGSSVTGALRALAEKQLINYAPYDVITLTPAGQEAAKDIVRRHEVLRDFYMKVLAVPEEEANEAACQMEHAVPKGILERFIKFVEFVEVCPRGGTKWIAGFEYYCDHSDAQEHCEQCLETTLEEVRKQRQQGGRENRTSMKLKELSTGSRAKVIKTTSASVANTRLAEMGLTPGAVVEIVRIAPLGDPVDVKVRGYHLSLRKAEADGIEVEPLGPIS